MTDVSARDIAAERTGGRCRDIQERAIEWLGLSLDCFDPFTYPASDRRGRLAARKALVELAGLLLQQRQVGVRDDDERYEAMVDLLASVASRRPYRDLIARQHRSLWLFGLPYAALRAWGRDDSELRAMIEQAVSARYPVTWERLPFRYLDYASFLNAGAVAHSAPAAHEVFPLTLLSARPNVAELEDDDVYAITHAVFYLTDFSSRESSWPDGFDRRDATELIETLLWQSVVNEHTDLTAELLISVVCLGVAPSGATAAAWELLHRLQLSNGAIPAPDRLLPPPYAGERDDPAYTEWRRCYHTTVMSAMACISQGRVAAAPGEPRAGIATANDAPSANAASQGAGSSRVAHALRTGAAWLREHAADSSSRAALDAADTAPSIAEISACADLRTLLELESTKHNAQRSALPFPMSNRSALSLTRSALHGDVGMSTRARWGAYAVRAFREYRLDNAAILVSAIALAGGATERAVRDVAEALLAQQRVDGSFGYAATDVENGELAAARRTWTGWIVWALVAVLDPDAVRPAWADALDLSQAQLTAR